MSISFHGIGQVCTTFLGSNIAEGHVVKMIANGTVAAKANAVNLEEMHALLDHAKKTAADLTDHIREGQIDVAPASCGDWNACQWCDYASVCRRDPRLPGGDFRELSDMNREEFAMRLANSSLHAGEKAEN